MVVLADVVLALVKAIVLLWGALTNWAYRLVYRSHKKVNNFNKVGGSNIILIFLGLVGISFGPVATTWKKIHLRNKLDMKESNEAQMFPSLCSNHRVCPADSSPRRCERGPRSRWVPARQR